MKRILDPSVSVYVGCGISADRACQVKVVRLEASCRVDREVEARAERSYLFKLSLPTVSFLRSSNLLAHIFRVLPIRSKYRAHAPQYAKIFQMIQWSLIDVVVKLWLKLDPSYAEDARFQILCPEARNGSSVDIKGRAYRRLLDPKETVPNAHKRDQYDIKPALHKGSRQHWGEQCARTRAV